jgi:surfeit locus 1 family protein
MPNPTAPAAARAPRRFRPGALPTLAMLVAVAVCAAAGRWQQGRMHDKEALREQMDAALRLAPVALAGLPGPADWTTLRYRQVVAGGAYRAQAQILIDNRVHDGRAGYHVVTPLELPDGRAVLVNRGWVAQGASRTALPDVPAPAGTVTVQGRIVVPSAGYLELKTEAAAGAVWQNLDPARFAAATGIAVLPVVIEQTAAPAPDDGLVRDWPAPDFGIDKHRIYMVQWYSFATLAIVLWVVLNLRRSPPADHG